VISDFVLPSLFASYEEDALYLTPETEDYSIYYYEPTNEKLLIDLVYTVTMN